MGYTDLTIAEIKGILSKNKITSVCDLGAQNNYAQPKLPAPYMREWYEALGYEYTSIDLSGEDVAKKWDLSKPLKTTKKFDLVVDAGTSEHVKDYFQCLENIHQLTNVGGIIYRENPLTGHWPDHGLNYVTYDFYPQLAALTAYEIIELKVVYACHNYDTGGNVLAILRKTKEEFITREQMPTYFKS